MLPADTSPSRSRPPPTKSRRFSASASTPSVAARRTPRPKFSSVRRSRPRHRPNLRDSSPSPDHEREHDHGYDHDHSHSHEDDIDFTFSSSHISDEALDASDHPFPPSRPRTRGLSQPDLPDVRAFQPPAFDDDRKPLTYSSLPSTPILASPPPYPSAPSPTSYASHHDHEDTPPFSLWDYLREELLATDFDSHQELKWERVSNFLNIPVAIEKIISFGFILCFDSFLYTFTIQPIRFVLAMYRVILNFIARAKKPLPPSQKADILRTLLLVLSVIILVPLTDASKIYHSIRGQDTIKLYVIFNALEIADRLCASIGQDIIDCLFSRSNLTLLSRRVPFTAHTLRPVLFFALALLYTVVHALVMVYQLLCLNVAINSYDNALLSLLMSNQFVEIKGSVFKKFEKDNLFQITCADIVERFTLGLMLFFVAFRNLIELSGSEFDFSEGFFLPKSFGWLRGGGGASVLWTISYPVVTVMLSETLVDWLKHAFITKFNHIRPSVYERYTDVLCRDLASGSAVGRLGARKHTYVDQSPLVARRLGFSALPLAVLTILIGAQSLGLLISHPMLPTLSLSGARWEWEWWESLLRNGLNAQINWEEAGRWAKWTILGLTMWMCVVLIKIIMGVNLVSYASRRRAGMEAREAADVVNDFGRDPIGEGRDERAYNRELKTLLDNRRDDTMPTAEIGETAPGGGGKGNGGGGGDGNKKRYKLEELTRFTMVKRIW